MASLFIRKVKEKKTGYIRIQLCSNSRVNGKVKQKIIRHIGIAHTQEQYEDLYKVAVATYDREIQKLTDQDSLFGDTYDLLYKHTEAPILKSFEEENEPVISVNDLIEEKRVVDGPEDFYGTLFENFKFNSILEKKSDSDLLKELIIERISNPKSKLKTIANISENRGKKCSLNKAYRLLDKLDKNNKNILEVCFNGTTSLLGDDIDIIFFDVTTLYMESISEDELRKFGYSKDQKFHSVQITLALASSKEGVPIGYKLFPGNTGEIKTLIDCVSEWKKILNIKKVTFVCDRWMFSLKNLYEIESHGYYFITAMPMRKLKGQIKEEILKKHDEQKSLYEPIYMVGENIKQKIYWTKDFFYTQKGKILNDDEKIKTKYKSCEVEGRIISTFNSSRAEKDSKDRQRIIDKIKKTLENKKKPTTKDFISNSGYKKYLKNKKNEPIELDLSKVNEDEKWDGLHGLFTNLNSDHREIIMRYKNLVNIENTFRLSKSFLKMRPVFHYRPSRIRGHVALCYISLCLTKYAEILLQREGLKLSPEVLREELNRVQYSIIKDKTNRKKYKMPSQMSEKAKAIYKVLGLKRKTSTTIL